MHKKWITYLVIAGTVLWLPVFVSAQTISNANDIDYTGLHACLDALTEDFQATMDLWAEIGSTVEKVTALTDTYRADTRACYVQFDAVSIMPYELRNEDEKKEFDAEHSLIACLRGAGDTQQEETEVCTDQYLDDVYDTNLSQYEASEKLNACILDRSVEAYTQKAFLCYENAEFGNIWDLPVLKKALSESILDTKEFYERPEAHQRAAECVVGLLDEQGNYTSDVATYERQVASCFEQEGFLNTAELYKKTAILIDCANESFESAGVEDVSVFWRRDKKTEDFIEQCILEKTSPVMTVLAAANIPFASGIYNALLYLQFLFTQPLLLFARKRRKSWGHVFNVFTKQPVDLSVVRLFDHKQKRLVKSMVTGRNGSYLFLVPPGEYRVEVDKRGFSFPSAIARHEGHESYYFGEEIGVDSEDDVIDEQVPVDPEEASISVSKFKWRKWRYRITLFVAFLAPLFSALSFLLVPKLWVALLLVLHIVLLVIFIRLGLRRHKRYGVVRTKGGKVLSGVVVSLFSKEYNKLIEYHVTDMFGRYFFPAVEGEFIVQFKKDGLKEVKKDLTITANDLKKGSIGLDITLEAI